MPQIEEPGVTARVITGTLFGETSPVETHWETVYADVAMNGGASIPFDADAEERAVYLVEGCIEIDGTEVEAGTMAVLKPAEAATIKAGAPSRLMLLGGAAMDGPRYIWLNLVSSDKERIEQAKADWQAGKFDPVPDETEFIPLPDTPGPLS
ncbi:MAG: pirin family protein [Rhodospirillales bacterium]